MANHRADELCAAAAIAGAARGLGLPADDSERALRPAA